MNWVATVIVDTDTGNHIKIGDKVECETYTEEKFEGEITAIALGGGRFFGEPSITIEIDQSKNYVKKAEYRLANIHMIKKLNGKDFSWR